MCCIINRYVIYHPCKNTEFVDINLLSQITATPGMGVLSRTCVIPLASGWVWLWFVKTLFYVFVQLIYPYALKHKYQQAFLDYEALFLYSLIHYSNILRDNYYYVL